MIPQYEPVIDYDDVNSQISAYLSEKGWITEFKKTVELENRIKKFLEVKHCSMVFNGTISLSLALLAVGVEPGDEVIVPDLTMIATPNAVRFIGAKPVLVDVEPRTLCMDMVKAQSAVTDKTKAFIYVTYNGRSCDPVNLQEFAFLNNISYISDDAQSLGSRYKNGERIGRYGDIASFSFSMPKIITTGQGGCLVTNNDVLADKLKKLKDFGRTGGGIDIHDEFGINCKVTELQSITGLSQFRDIDDRICNKRLMFNMYHAHLKDVPQITMLDMDLSHMTPWFIDIFVEDRVGLVKHLEDNKIKTRIMYPPIHSQKCYGITGDFDVTTEWSNKGLWLPSSLNLSFDQIVHICNHIKGFYNGTSYNNKTENS